MNLEPIDQTAARFALPRRADDATGLFAWGARRLPRRRLNFAWAEFLWLFMALPLVGLVFGAPQATPIAISTMFWSALILLSMTRSFRWADLLPTDFLSEWRHFLVCAAGCCFLSVGLTLALAPERLFLAEARLPPLYLTFPLLIALPIELMYRALFFRRFGYLFQTETGAVAVSALANGLIYLMLSDSFALAAFGVATGLMLGWTYLRTGQFVLTVLIHWAAALSLWMIGPGLITL